jgi:CelD/BcsL family acetyltransferase involved in cellulose biosynthesis
MNDSVTVSRVEAIASTREFLALEQAWEDLEVQPSAPPFLTWAWLSTWWRHFGARSELWVLCAYSPEDVLVGLAPLHIRPERLGPLSVRCVRFLGAGVVAPDHLDVIARPGMAAAVAEACAEHMADRRSEWDVLELRGFAPRAALGRALAARFEASGARGAAPYRRLEATSTYCPYIALPESWEAYVQQLSSRRRRHLRQHQRHLEADYPGKVVYSTVQGPEHLAAALDALIRLHRKRWHDRGMLTAFDDRRYVAFHREVAAAFLRRGWLRLWTLAVGGTVVAVDYGLRVGNTFYAYQAGFDPDWADYSVGALLLAHTIREAIAEGAREYDLLRGLEPYKASWSNGTREEHHLLVSASWRGGVWLDAVRAFEAARVVGKRVLPDAIKVGLERRISRLHART